VSELVEHPPQACGDGAGDIVVGDDVVVGPDPSGLEPVAEDPRVGERMAARAARRSEVRVEIEEDRTREMAAS